MFTVVYCHQPCRRRKIEKSTVETEVGRPRTEDGKDEFFRHLTPLALSVVPSSGLRPLSSVLPAVLILAKQSQWSAPSSLPRKRIHCATGTCLSREGA